mmetsp:Transcript_11869/g.32236  ORF Transcript_11869/g.32236 Transcript_11869/m.32236 type:complete len:206 (+) Transcript_11869:740-1357(+)
MPERPKTSLACSSDTRASASLSVRWNNRAYFLNSLSVGTAPKGAPGEARPGDRPRQEAAGEAEREREPCMANSDGFSWMPCKKVMSSGGKVGPGGSGAMWGGACRALPTRCMPATNSGKPSRPMRCMSTKFHMCPKASSGRPDRWKSSLASPMVTEPSLSKSVRRNSRAYFRSCDCEGTAPKPDVLPPGDLGDARVGASDRPRIS